MKWLAIVFLCLSCGPLTQAQKNSLAGSLTEKQRLLKDAKEDTERVRLMLDVSFLSMLIHPDTCFLYAQRAFQLASKLHREKDMEFGLIQMGAGLRFAGNYPKAIDCELKALQLGEKLNDTAGLIQSYGFLGTTYWDQGYSEQALSNLLKSRKYCYMQQDPFWTTIILSDLGYTYAQLNQLDSALSIEEIAAQINSKYNFHFPFLPFSLAAIDEKRGLYGKAIDEYRLCIQFARVNNIQRDILLSYVAIGRVYKKLGGTDSSVYYLNKVLKDTEYLYLPVKLDAVNILSSIYEQKNNKDSMVKYLKWKGVLQDSAFGQEKARQVQNMTYSEFFRQQEMADDKTRMEELSKKNVQKWWFAGSVLALVFLSFYIFYRYRIAQLMKLQAIRNEISKDLHDDIGSTLSSISILSEVARNKMEEGQHEQSLSVLGKINTYSHEMIEKMSDIVWAVNSGDDRIEDLIQRIKNAVVETCALKKIGLEFQVDEGFRNQELSITVRKNIYLICKEAVNNAIKHAGCSKINAYFKTSSSGLAITIRDDGNGFDPENATAGNGLKNIRLRVAEINGAVVIQSMKNNTVIGIEIPVPKTQ